MAFKQLPCLGGTGGRVEGVRLRLRPGGDACTILIASHLLEKIGAAAGGHLYIWIGDGEDAGWLKLEPTDDPRGYNLSLRRGIKCGSPFVVISAARIGVPPDMPPLDCEYRLADSSLLVKLPDLPRRAA